MRSHATDWRECAMLLRSSGLTTVYPSQHILHATDKVVVGDVPFVSPEVPARAEAILEAIRTSELGPVVPPQDYGLRPILAVHSADYITYLKTAFKLYAAYAGQHSPVMSSRGRVNPRREPVRPLGIPALIDYYTYDYEDPILDGTWEAAYWSAQAAVTAAAMVKACQTARGPSAQPAAYALCRPPGHHAEEDRYGGFCYLNNAAIAARWLSDQGRVVILDVDYHHGNGTQSIFYRDSEVCYVSLHADPRVDYPYYWGYQDEGGEGPGAGTNVNLPLPIGVDDSRYLNTLDTALAAVQDFRSVYLVVSMGLDAVAGDTIGKFDVTSEGWREAGRRIAAQGLPTVIVQEGGYAVGQLGDWAVGFLSAFC